MNTLTDYGVEELDRSGSEAVSGGNPVALGIAMATMVGAGIKFGYTVVGPWLDDHGWL
jgi:hypothetical protein